MTITAVADPAGDADRFEPSLKIQPVGIDQVGCMLHLAAQTDRIAADGCKIGARRFRHVTRQTKIAHTVWCFGELPEELAGRFKGSMHIPKRASAAKTGELQPGG